MSRHSESLEQEEFGPEAQYFENDENQPNAPNLGQIVNELDYLHERISTLTEIVEANNSKKMNKRNFYKTKHDLKFLEEYCRQNGYKTFEVEVVGQTFDAAE
ncbi:unnamed protein product [Caenorhabditis auriculariae]|uniref:Uncharacterized protein n=1 Tax=Caenorhabditis auriculariae TaxID=2777116 RepID=A0A8S1HQB2_9PELO|nr:unnamed protein product [Caenorhabditis auriculariae]